MTFAHVGIHIKHVAGEITESENVIALCSIHGQHIVSEIGRGQVSLRPMMGQHRIQCHAELTSLRLARLDVFQEQHCALQLVVRLMIRQLALCTIRYQRPAQWMVMAT